MAITSDQQIAKATKSSLSGDVACISRFSLYHGPGIRTLVTMASGNQDSDIDDDGIIDRAKFETMTVSSVVDAVRRDQLFYRNSGGGVTIGGIEPAQQTEFVEAVLTQCRDQGIHTAFETRGCLPEDDFISLASQTNLILFELAHMDCEIQQQYSGCDSEFDLDNMINASKIVDEVIIRLPLITGFNDDLDNIEAIGRFISEQLTNVRQVDILPYIFDEESEGNEISFVYGYDPKANIDFERVEQTRSILESFGLRVYVGG